MIYYLMRQTGDEKEPLALLRINAAINGDMQIMSPRPSRFGPLAPVYRKGQHVYNLLIGNNEDVMMALWEVGRWKLEQVKQAEWESWAEMELFPVLKTAMAK